MIVNWVMYPDDASISVKISAARREASEYAASKKKTIYVFATDDHIEYTDDAAYAHARCEDEDGLICIFSEDGIELHANIWGWKEKDDGKK